MIVTEKIKINGKTFNKTYSDEHFMIEREGVMYTEAIDPEHIDRKYTETDVKIVELKEVE